MATEKVSLSIDEDLVSAARRLAGERGLSAYVNEALRRKLQYDKLGLLLEELESRAGPVPDEAMKEARRRWQAFLRATRKRARTA